MVFWRSKAFLLAFLYLLSTTFLYLSTVNISENIRSLDFVWNDKGTFERLGLAIQSDHDSRTIWLTRIFHNKPLALLDTFLVSIYRALDISFLFSLTDHSSPFESKWKISMLSPLEFPFFLLALVTLVTQWVKFPLSHRRFLFMGIGGSLIIVGILMPSVHSVKLLPLVLVVRIIIILGIGRLLVKSSWSKRYFS